MVFVQSFAENCPKKCSFPIIWAGIKPANLAFLTCVLTAFLEYLLCWKMAVMK